MKIASQLLVVIALMLSPMLNSASAQIKNSQTASVKVYGNCGMCKKNIEAAANKKGAVKAKWDESTKMLSFTFDSKKTSAEEILQRVADAGYDNEKFSASASAYSKLHSCCQYERKPVADSTKVK